MKVIKALSAPRQGSNTYLILFTVMNWADNSKLI